ncbi:autotransporter outer membrane beta-barrel domain-containing protein [Aquabacter spiritensis]|nr:autotransporter outer membrane beta-barrel domain-containing protein [Aquabacter spiritensis]
MTLSLKRRLSLGASAAVLILAGSLAATRAGAEDTDRLVLTGKDGQNARLVYFGFNDPSTPGETVGAITVSDNYFTTLSAIGPAVTIGAAGGKGGNGLRTLTAVDNASDGGWAGDVFVKQSGDLAGRSGTPAGNSALLLVYSRGGEGGGGGQSGRGGTAGQVNLTVTSNITATGGRLAGIWAQSRGGAAGAGGNPQAWADSHPGGDGGVVTVLASGAVSTDGSNAPAIVAESLGGAGGKGQNFWLHGDRPTVGGGGNDVTVTTADTALVTTKGANSAAIVAQSVGGVGADAVSGSGSQGGRTGVVRVTQNGTITTSGNYSFGILAQSVGGSGGSGGFGVFKGGAGAAAGAGNDVTVINTGRIATLGVGATAIVAQSVGGGRGGDAFSAEPFSGNSAGGNGGSAAFFASGGAGGTGGFGRHVTVANTGSIATEGAGAYGILAQSVGGGGGRGGSVNSGSIFFSLALGGSGGTGGDGGIVTVTNRTASTSSGQAAPIASIATAGESATAIFAQSVGGAGGAGGTANTVAGGFGGAIAIAIGGSGGAGGTGGEVTVTNDALLTTSGANALGIRAQSVGGGGGMGGSAKAMALAQGIPGTNSPTVSLTYTVGGSGGDGGGGGKVTVTNTGTIATSGVNALGVEAMSIGGGGGDAGSAASYALSIAMPGQKSISGSYTVGGTGGKGIGGGGVVTVTNSGAIVTQGTGAIGIRAMSVGGGGGNGGDATATVDVIGTKQNIGIASSIGGKGGGSGDGGEVTVTNTNRIETRGEFATGIVAQSIGGGGGNGAIGDASASGGFSWDKTIDGFVKKLPMADVFSGNLNVGGDGGLGGSGKAATVKNSARIETFGSNSAGIFAQSVGGGGGNAGGYQAGGQGTLTARLQIGGKGAGGGTGGNVVVENQAGGKILTHADGAYGISAQSVGGGGGNGGTMTAKRQSKPDVVGGALAKVKELVGITAYDKWAADKANKTEKEKLEQLTKDIKSTDFYKKLLDSDIAKGFNEVQKKYKDWEKEQKSGGKKLPDASLTLSFGGSGGSGGRGGAVTVTNDGSIATSGNIATGIFAQSIGGGGGNGGVASASGANSNSFTFSFGGNGGSGNSGGGVIVTNTGSITTVGNSAFAIMAQSIGGGGGLGVGAIGADNDAKTKKYQINGTLGGSGGSGADGGTVTVTNSSTISTKGLEAHAIVAQSVGGGGGAFVVNPDDGIAPEMTEEEKQAQKAVDDFMAALGVEKTVPDSAVAPAAPAKAAASDGKDKTISGALVLGGSGGMAGVGNTVSVTHSGTIITSGTAAFGIMAQSVGGGGGFSNSGGSIGGYDTTLTLGGAGGAAGKGGNVTVTLGGKAAITTIGDNAIAIFAQSVGGGGGYGGASKVNGQATPLTIREGGNGDGGLVTIAMGSPADKATITTSGKAAHGIFAQSLAGGGGTSAQYSGMMPASSGGERRNGAGRAGGITVSYSGSITASGEGAYGIFAQSGMQTKTGALNSERAGSTISITYGGGTLEGGGGTGAAIRIDGGNMNSDAIPSPSINANTITVNSDATVKALSGMAVLASFGTDNLVNYGTMIGGINLAYGDTREANFFTNHGTYRTGADSVSVASAAVNLGRGGAGLSAFGNLGTFDIGGVGTISKASLTGDFSQTKSGRILVDVTSGATDHSPRSDVLNVSGSVRSLAGTAVANVVGSLRPDTFLIVDGHIAQTPTLTVVSANTGSPFTWAVQAPTTNGVKITPQANFLAFGGAGLSDSQKNMLGGLQTTWDKGVAAPGKMSQSAATTFGNLARATSRKDFQQAADSATPDESSSTLTSQTLNARASLHAALSCPVFVGSGTMMEETSCAWARIIGNWTRQTSSDDMDGYDANAVTYRVGVQKEIVTDWFLGATVGFTQSWLNGSDGYSSTSGNGADAAISLKHQIGPWLFSASGHLGFGSYETDRVLDIGPSVSTSSGTANVLTAAARLRASYEFAFANWYVKPYADLDILYTHMPSYQEQGFGPTLGFSGAEQWNLAVSPNVEFGGRVDLSSDLWLRPFATVGMTFFAKDSMPLDVTLAAAGDPIATFTTEVTIPQTLVNLAAGLQLFSTKGYEIKAEYKADIGDDYLNQELSARLAVPF